MLYCQSDVVSSGTVPLFDTLDLTAGVQGWRLSDFCSHYVRFLYAREAAEMIANRWRGTTINRRGARDVTDNVVRDGRWKLIYE